VALYDQLLALRPTPVVAMNRAVAVAELDGPTPGLAALEALDAARWPATSRSTPPAPTSSPVPGRTAEAVAAYDRAIELTTNEAERAFLESQRAARL
jgi:predicted RNA polymerase sigma factor